MVDIIDVVLARAMTPQGKIETYAAAAQKAVADANNAKDSYDELAANVEETASNANAALATASEVLEDVTDALAHIDATVIGDLDDEVDKLAFQLQNVSAQTYSQNNIGISYPSGKTETLANVIRYYTQSGQNTDGTMTQKAITDAIAAAVADVPHGGGTAEIDLGTENAGKIVTVSNDGGIQASELDMNSLVDFLISEGYYDTRDTLGIEIDFENKTVVYNENSFEEIDPSLAAVFNRRRCNVSDSGIITAWYGDSNYKDDGSNGQVMVYQPKFYYKRASVKSAPLTTGEVSRKELLIISAVQRDGFRLHPLFENTSTDYVLISAYEGGLWDASAGAYNVAADATIDFNADKLSSVAGVKPVTGTTTGFNAETAEKLAQNRGAGWHITTMAAESALQMLLMTEFCTLNAQTAIEQGICQISNATGNYAAITGSTAALGNETGHASSTIIDHNGSRTAYNTEGYRAISYRGMENPWGDVWRIIGDCRINGDSAHKGGLPQLKVNNEWVNVGFNLPNNSNWISALAIGDEAYDWVLMPGECASGANSAAPVGDSCWTTNNLNSINYCAVGGRLDHKLSDGPFYYACDRDYTNSQPFYGARLMYIPQ